MLSAYPISRKVNMVELNHVSHSQLDMYLGCPRKWAMKYVYKKPERPSDNLILGSCYHSALEHNFTQKIKSHVDLSISDVEASYVDAVKLAIVAAKNKLSTYEPSIDIEDIGLGLVRAYMIQVAPSVQPIEVELQVNSIIGDTNIIFKIDLIDENLTLIDHKTSAKKYTQDKADNDNQLTAYAYSQGSDCNCAFHVALKHKSPSIQVLPTTRSIEQILWWRAMAIGIINSMRAGIEYPNTSGWLCSPEYCDFWDDCMPTKRTIQV